MQNLCAIIPARYKSKRLPGKPLIKISNKELLLLTYEKVKKIFREKDIYVFTESNKVKKKLNKKIKNIILFDGKFRNGTERASHGLKYIKKKYKAAMLISCDNPFIMKNSIIKCLETYNGIKNKNEYCGSTIHAKNNNLNIFKNKSVAKIVLDQKNDVMYLSRSSIPYNYKKNNYYFTHHGPVCLKIKNLKMYSYSRDTPLQLAEDNEWLKMLEKGFKIRSSLVKKINPEINTYEDLKIYKKKMKIND